MSDTPADTPPAPRAPGVLLAEDQAALRGLLGLALSAAGARVFAAADGGEAVALFRGHPDAIDAALLDRGMPVLDGPATLAALRALRPALPCCLMTGAGPDAEEELLARGATCVLAKPFDVPDMVALMLGLCASASGAAPLRVLAANDEAGALCRLMALWGHEARAAAGEVEVLKAAAEFGPDVILLDPGPSAEGLALAGRLHELPGLKWVVLVALTDRGDDEYRRLTRDAGFAMHVVKPPGAEELEAALKLLAREKAKRPTE